MTPSARRPPADTRQRRSTAEVRALILSVAEEVFARRGYADASTVEIARLAGVERSVLYRHFGSKTGLFREAIAAPFLRFIESWSPPPIDRLPADLPDALLMRHFVAGLFEQLLAHRQAMVLLLYRSDELDPELREHVVRTIREGLDSLSEPIRANMTARQFAGRACGPRSTDGREHGGRARRPAARHLLRGPGRRGAGALLLVGDDHARPGPASAGGASGQAEIAPAST